MTRCLTMLLMMWALAGCQSAKVAQPLTRELSGSDPQTQLEFWHTLAQRPVTSNDEALHGLLLYLDGSDAAADYPGRVSLLQSRGLLSADFDRPADHAVRRGTLAVAIVRALQIKGGLMLHVLKFSPRYAVRELEYEGLYPASSPGQTFSGTEFVGVIGRIEDYQRSHVQRSPARLLPSEVDHAPNPPAPVPAPPVSESDAPADPV